MDDGPANGLELSSLRDRKPLNDSTGSRIFVAGTSHIPTAFFETPSCFSKILLLYFYFLFPGWDFELLKRVDVVSLLSDSGCQFLCTF
jgi:hypothetical protein